MGFWDYVPVVGGIKNGDWERVGKDLITGGLYSPISAANQHFFTDPANKIKAAYDQAAGQTDKDRQELMNYYQQNKQQALGFYKPLQQMFSNAYGTQGIAAPQIPKSPGKPLAGMYGGG